MKYISNLLEFLGDGLISKEELKKFYEIISGIDDPKTLERTTNEGYRALTAVSFCKF